MHSTKQRPKSCQPSILTQLLFQYFRKNILDSYVLFYTQTTAKGHHMRAKQNVLQPQVNSDSLFVTLCHFTVYDRMSVGDKHENE